MDPLLPWFVLLNPLIIAALIHLVLGRERSSSTFASVLSAFAGLVAAIGIWFSDLPVRPLEFPWLDFGPGFRVAIGITIDPLSKVMLLVVTGIGALIHLYSTVYMAEDASKGRYFGNLSLFMFSML